MLLSLKWLREFVPVEAGAQEVGDRLTMLGLELEDIIHPYDAIKDIVVGHVLTKEAHPDSDHLAVCTVDAGQEEVLNIVCGAPNVAADRKCRWRWWARRCPEVWSSRRPSCAACLRSA